MSIIKWWINVVIHWGFWFFCWRQQSARPKPMTAKRCEIGHLLGRKPDGTYEEPCC